MTFPGENIINLSSAAIMRLVQERINADLRTGGPIVRVTAIKYTSYGSGAEFTVSSDPLPSSDNITTTTKEN